MRAAAIPTNSRSTIGAPLAPRPWIPYPLSKVSLSNIQCLHRIPYPYLAAPDAVGSAVIEGGTGPRERERERERHTHTA